MRHIRACFYSSGSKLFYLTNYFLYLHHRLSFLQFNNISSQGFICSFMNQSFQIRPFSTWSDLLSQKERELPEYPSVFRATSFQNSNGQELGIFEANPLNISSLS